MVVFKVYGECFNVCLMVLVLIYVGMFVCFVDFSECGFEVIGMFNDVIVSLYIYGNLYVFKYDFNQCFVFLGFFGFMLVGWIVIFVCGGFDMIGVILVCGLWVCLYENFIDVDVIYIVNFNIVDNLQLICQMIYWEMWEFFYVGFLVF